MTDVEQRYTQWKARKARESSAEDPVERRYQTWLKKRKRSTFPDTDNRHTQRPISIYRKDQDTAQNWYQKSADVVNEVYQYYSDWKPQNEQKYQYFQNTTSSLLSEADKWRSQFAGNDEALSAIDEVVSALETTSENLPKSYDYWSRWDSEEAYNKALAAQKDREEKSIFDLDAGAKEIEELEAIYDDAYTVESWYNTYQMNPNAWDAQTVNENMAKYNALVEKYGSLAELDSLIQNKKQYLHHAEYIQEGIALASVAENDDFAEFSSYVSTKDDGFWSRLTSDYGLGYSDLTYEYINNQNGLRDEIKHSHTNFNRGHGGSDSESIYEEKGYDFMEEDEIAIYNYHYAKEGKDAAERYLDSIQETLNAKKAGAVFEPLKDNTALELLFGVEAGLDQFASGMKNLFNTKDDYIPSSATQMASAMVREDLADNSIPVWYNFKDKKWEDKVLGHSVGQVAYDTITTSANMAPSILTSLAIEMVAPGVGSWVGSGMMGASAAGNAYQQALNEGFSKEQARGYSFLVGASEVVMEKVLGGISALGGNALGKYFVKNIGAADTALKMIAKSLGGSVISEFTEEYLQEVLNPVFRNMALGTDEEVKLFSADALYSGILGALTAGIMEGPGIIYSETKTYRTGKQLQTADISPELLAELGKMFPAGTSAHQLAALVDENSSAYTIGRLFHEIGATLSAQNKADITASLEQKGMDTETAAKNAEILAYIAEGGTLTETQRAVLESNDVLAQTAQEVLFDENNTIYKRTATYEKMLASRSDSPAPINTDAQARAELLQEMTGRGIDLRHARLAATALLDAGYGRATQRQVDFMRYMRTESPYAAQYNAALEAVFPGSTGTVNTAPAVGTNLTDGPQLPSAGQALGRAGTVNAVSKRAAASSITESEHRAEDISNKADRTLLPQKALANTQTEDYNTRKSNLASLSLRFLSNRDGIYKNMENVPPLEGYEDVAVHADPYSFGFVDPETGETVQSADARFLAKRLRESGKYTGGPIRLIACESGKVDDGIAQALANELGVPVFAPTKTVYIDSQGYMVLADDLDEALELMSEAEKAWNPDGWKVFTPRKE